MISSPCWRVGLGAGAAAGARGRRGADVLLAGVNTSAGVRPSSPVPLIAPVETAARRSGAGRPATDLARTARRRASSAGAAGAAGAGAGRRMRRGCGGGGGRGRCRRGFSAVLRAGAWPSASAAGSSPRASPECVRRAAGRAAHRRHRAPRGGTPRQLTFGTTIRSDAGRGCGTRSPPCRSRPRTTFGERDVSPTCLSHRVMCLR